VLGYTLDDRATALAREGSCLTKLWTGAQRSLKPLVGDLSACFVSYANPMLAAALACDGRARRSISSLRSNAQPASGWQGLFRLRRNEFPSVLERSNCASGSAVPAIRRRALTFVDATSGIRQSRICARAPKNRFPNSMGVLSPSGRSFDTDLSLAATSRGFARRSAGDYRAYLAARWIPRCQ